MVIFHISNHNEWTSGITQEERQDFTLRYSLINLWNICEHIQCYLVSLVYSFILKIFIKFLKCVRVFPVDTNVKGRNVFICISTLKNGTKIKTKWEKIGQIEGVSLEKKGLHQIRTTRNKR